MFLKFHFEVLYRYIVRVTDHIATVSEVSLKAVSLYSPCRYIVLEPLTGIVCNEYLNYFGDRNRGILRATASHD